MKGFKQIRFGHLLKLASLILFLLAGFTSADELQDNLSLKDFATRYAAAWSSQDPESLASFYSENGSLKVNDGDPSRGRGAIEATARDFMTAFPDMIVQLTGLESDGDRVIFHWRWTGTNTGPGGTGNAVDINGYEVWTMGADGLIAESLGHYDEAGYQRQVNKPVTGPADR